MALNKPLESIDEGDLQELIDNQVPEGKTIEYKEALPGNSDGDKKEFLADVSLFANAAGGNLIFGMKEDSGTLVEIRGLQISNVDAEILRLENIIQTGIAPRLPVVHIHSVPLPSKPQQCALIIRVRKSWLSPHMVTFRNDSKFYTRNSRGKYQLDVSELRTAFLLSETTAERIRNFRAERLSMIVAGVMSTRCS
jgi:predicted HTH transcriptional regulator